MYVLKLIWQRARHQLLLYSLLIIGLYFYWDPIWLWGSLVSFIIIALFGGEIGLHRYFAHRSFTCSKLVDRFLLVCSVLCASGPTILWVGHHRLHHRYADTDKDSHNVQNQPILNYFHCNDITQCEYNFPVITKDLWEDPVHKWLLQYYNYLYCTILIIAGLIDPYILVYIFVIPALLQLHALGLIAVPSHMFGYQNFKSNSNDRSTNNALVAFLTFGSGWHNNHHNKQWSYTTKVKPWEFDISGWVIKKFLAKEVKT